MYVQRCLEFQIVVIKMRIAQLKCGKFLQMQYDFNMQCENVVDPRKMFKITVVSFLDISNN